MKNTLDYTPVSSVRIGPIELGSGTFTVIAGPCAIESSENFFKISTQLKELGVPVLRGGIYKLRTDPKSFQGLGDEVFSWLPEMKKHLNLPLVSEITDARQIEKLDTVVDCYQVGTRNMFNYELLKELGKQKKPVILKRNFAALIKEWLLAADYISQGGNDQVILCERGIRTFETATRNTLDLTAVAYLKQNHSYPVLVDPSHAAGQSKLVAPLALASKAAGADGILIEVHTAPEKALSDGEQSLTVHELNQLLKALS